MPYLTNNEYLDRVGEAETVRVTDEDRSGSVDTAKLTKAISDAGEEINSFLGRRYAIPLASTPELVKNFTAIIAREYLHKTRATEAVKADAERVRGQLRDLARGVTVLPGVTGSVEATTGLATSATSGDGNDPIFTQENLAGFGVPSGSCEARWRQ